MYRTMVETFHSATAALQLRQTLLDVGFPARHITVDTDEARYSGLSCACDSAGNDAGWALPDQARRANAGGARLTVLTEKDETVEIVALLFKAARVRACCK